jgi:hypothetical protein
VEANGAPLWHWGRQLAVTVGCTIAALEGDERADAYLKLMRADAREFPGRSCMIRRATGGGGGAA